MLTLPSSLQRVMLRAILRRPFQAAMFILGVALGVAMMVAIDIANASATRAFGIFTESLTGRTTHQIVGGPSGVPYELYRQLRLELGVREAAPVVTAYAQALELDGQPLRIFGIDPFAEAPFRGYLNLGAANANADIAGVTAFLTQPNMVLMAEQLAAQYGLQEGDTLTMRYGPTRHTLTIAGLLRPSDDVTAQGLQDMLIADISTAQEVLNMLGRLTNIDLIIPETPDGEALLARLDITEARCAKWAEIAAKMYVPRDPETGVLEQFDGFFSLERLDLTHWQPRVANMDWILGHARAQRTMVIKQADIVMLMALLGDQFGTPDVQQANWDFYYPLVDHGSSLSPSTHAWVAARLGLLEDAYKLFIYAANIDLEDLKGNVRDGIHAAASGGVWQAIAFGFVGLSLDARGELQVKPNLPPHWRSVTLRAYHRGQLKTIRLTAQD